MSKSVVTLLFVGLTAISALPQYRPPVPQKVVKVIKFVPPSPRVVPAQVVPAPVVPAPVAYAPQVRSGVQDKDASVVAGYRDVNYDGTFSYGYDTDNSISVKSKGYLKNPQSPNEGPIQVIEGSYSFYDKEGRPVSISYIADEAGFRAVGDAIPTPPLS